MGGGIIVIFFGFLLMWGVAIVPAYAIIRKPTARIHFILRVVLSIVVAFVLALVVAGIAMYWRSKWMLGAYFVVTVLASGVILFMLTFRKIVGSGSPSQDPFRA
ncbi:MAG: hypothetical protein JNM62_07420 [Flavobacteriales bacterium]|nr:hypothetical protein [Flavobacteriales bacterium]